MIHLATLQEELKNGGARLIAVSKTKSKEQIMELYEQGQRAFGENKVQEMVDKYESLPKDIEWHLIGHLQTNKVKYVVPFVHCIHSVDSLKIAREIQKEAQKVDRHVKVLLQMHIAEEETKFGLDKKELIDILDYYTQGNLLNNLNIQGLMGMATFTDNEVQIRKEFRSLKDTFIFAKESYLLGNSFCELSMGMSGDYKLAIQEGSTMVRIGSMLFGERK